MDSIIGVALTYLKRPVNQFMSIRIKKWLLKRKRNMNKQLEEKKNKFREKKIKNKEKGAGQKRDDKNEDTKFPVPEHKPVTLE